MLRQYRTAKLLTLAVGGVGLSYTLHVAYQRNKTPRDTVDNDVILDSLSTGDIILFRRNWYDNYIPAAVMIKAYQYYVCDFDHCGLVIVDRLGVPYLLENTPFQGYKMRPLKLRLQYSLSPSIVALALEPNAPTEKTKLLEEFARLKLRRGDNPEILQQCQCLTRFIYSYLFESKTIDKCAHVKFLEECFDSMGFNFVYASSHSSSLDEISKCSNLQDVANSSASLVQQSKNQDPLSPRFTFGEPVFLRLQ